MKRDQVNYNLLVAEKDGEFYFCDYIFKHTDGFKGATGSILRPISKGEYEERTTLEYLLDSYEDIWRESVSDGSTTQGLEDWCQHVSDIDGDEAFFDLSYPELWEQLRDLGYSEKEYPVFECTGGGRCFGNNDKYDKIYNQELLDKITEIES